MIYNIYIYNISISIYFHFAYVGNIELNYCMKFPSNRSIYIIMILIYDVVFWCIRWECSKFIAGWARTHDDDGNTCLWDTTLSLSGQWLWVPKMPTQSILFKPVVGVGSISLAPNGWMNHEKYIIICKIECIKEFPYCFRGLTTLTGNFAVGNINALRIVLFVEPLPPCVWFPTRG